MSISCALEECVNFEPLSGITSIFFDDKSSQIFSVRSRGATGIIVKGFENSLSSTFRLEDKGPIISIKLSPSQSVLTVQRSKSSVEFFNVLQLGANGNLDTNSYEQSARSKASVILGFYWTSENEITYLTTHGIEIYNVLPEKRQLKSIRNLNQLISWFVFCPISFTLVVSTTKTTSSLHVFQIKNGNISKLAKVDVEQPLSTKIEIKENDVQVFSLYSDLYMSIILHPSQPNQNSEIHLYTLASPVRKTHVLRTTFNGIEGLAMHSIDDVLVVHNRKDAETWFFDVGLSGEFDGSVSHHIPVGRKAQIPSDSEESEYPSHWVLFFPDIVIDANKGCMWRLKLKLDTVRAEDTVSPLELPRYISFMLQRQGAKRVLLDTLIGWCHHHTIDLATLGTSFNKINREYRLYIDQQLAPSLALPVASTFSRVEDIQLQKPSKVILEQSDMYTNIFSPLFEEATKEDSEGSFTFKKIIAIIIEYLRSLEERQIPAQHFLHELLINILVRSEQFYQLHQLLQYHVIRDSKPLACLLLSLEAVYPPSFQLAMDMLCRLRTSDELITEILLSKGKVISAIIFAKSRNLERTIPPRKFLEAASCDGALKQNVLDWLKNQKLLTAKDAANFAK